MSEIKMSVIVRSLAFQGKEYVTSINKALNIDGAKYSQKALTNDNLIKI